MDEDTRMSERHSPVLAPRYRCKLATKVAAFAFCELTVQALAQFDGLKTLVLLAPLLAPPARMTWSALSSRRVAQQRSLAGLSHMKSKILGMCDRA